jgi:hypothetical protein
MDWVLMRAPDFCIGMDGASVRSPLPRRRDVEARMMSRRAEEDYFERNAERMRYRLLRQQKLFVGSSVIEAACRPVIAQRLTLRAATLSSR